MSPVIFTKGAVKYMRGASGAQTNCVPCGGSGWTEEGWLNRAKTTDPFSGDCKVCCGTGTIQEKEKTDG